MVGMSCASCAARVDRVLNAHEGVIRADVNYAAATVQVEFDPRTCSAESLRKAVRDAGYDLVLPEQPCQGEASGIGGQAAMQEDLPGQEESLYEEAERIHESNYRSLRRKTVAAAALAVPIMVLSMAFMDIWWMKYLLCALSAPVVFWLGGGFFRSAWRQLRHGTANMDTLVAGSTGIAWLFSVFNMLFPQFWLSRGITPHVYFESSSMIIAFILLGRLLEDRAKRDTTSAIRSLAGLRPKTVTLVTPEGEKTVGISDVRPGDILAVKPGEKVAADGTVLSGDSYVDESMMSGEPVPVAKKPGDKVYAGTVNQRGSFRMAADKVGTDTVLSHIIHMVQDAQGTKAPVQKLVDRIAAVFVVVVAGDGVERIQRFVERENGLLLGLGHHDRFLRAEGIGRVRGGFFLHRSRGRLFVRRRERRVVFLEGIHGQIERDRSESLAAHIESVVQIERLGCFGGFDERSDGNNDVFFEADEAIAAESLGRGTRESVVCAVAAEKQGAADVAAIAG